MNYLKVGKATDLYGNDRILYRFFEILPGFLSYSTLFALIIFSYFQPVWVAFFIIAFDVYWLLLVVYLALYLITAYYKMKKNSAIDWRARCNDLILNKFDDKKIAADSLARSGKKWTDLQHLILLPTYNEGEEIIFSALQSLLQDGFPPQQMIVVVAMEERAGEEAHRRAINIKTLFQNKFAHLIITFHPDGMVGEIKGKGANQAWAIKQVKKDLLDPENFDFDNILVSVFDIDTIVRPGYFFALSYKFLTVSSPYRASYQPIPVYQNNLWEAPFFSRVAASSNTFWQMMMQIREEQLVTYSSHSMTLRALIDIGFWSTNMVSEDSRIFWHCLLYYGGDYRVEPLYFPVSMDITFDRNFIQTARSLYKQQRRWAWGAENVPYLMFNTIKYWHSIDRKKIAGHIFTQIYGFHSWATNALIIAVVGWMPMLLGGSRFNTTVLSGNLPAITQSLMNIAMIGLVLSAIISTLLLPKRPAKYTFFKNVRMVLEWIFVPITIIFFGSIPCFDAQWRLMRGKYMGFWVTPKSRS
ncbi:glycosyltransferase family 2 protein [Patescibacteria group bacterium]|nr:glycosyltransferase family 2 protein [Patescibacteria group bacterium]